MPTRTRRGTATTAGAPVQPSPEAIKTYRYVRCAMVVLVVGIAAAMFREHTTSNVWLGSISAYYYTPARGIFTAGLVGVGVCLIALRGPSPGEDLLLNIAGILAPVVAIVPTTPGARDCKKLYDSFLDNFDLSGVLPSTTSVSCKYVLAERSAAVSNNVGALLVIGLAGFGLLVGLVLWRRARLHEAWPPRGDLVGFGITAVVALMVGCVYVHHYDWFLGHAHYCAAVGMFVLIACCAIIDGIKVYRRLGRKLRGVVFVCIGALLMLGAGLLLWIGSLADWHHKVLAAELWGIAWFAMFWVSQTADLWDTTTRDKSPAAAAALAAAGPPPAAAQGAPRRVTAAVGRYFRF